MKLFQESLERVAHMVLEDWAMMLVDALRPEELDFERYRAFIAVRAEYQGVFDGELTLVCPEEFAAALTGNLLGDGGDFDVEDCRDSFKELANIVSGRFLTEAFGPETVFELPKLHVRDATPSEAAELLHSEALWLSGDEHPIGLSVEIKAYEATA